MTERLAGKKALVTGGSSGIGKSVVALFAREGATVACVASADRDKAQEVADEVGSVAGAVVPFVGDVSDWESAHRLVDEVARTLGGVDVLVTAAGVFYPTPMGGADRERVERMIAVNLTGTLAAIDAAVPLMKSGGGGKIVCIGSIAGVIGLGTYATYCATKFAVSGVVKALAVELAPHGINVNAIAPGNTETPINEDIRTKPELREYYELMKARTPSRRVYSKPEDVARAALYLASEDSVAMYGSTLVIDEGFTAGA